MLQYRYFVKIRSFTGSRILLILLVPTALTVVFADYCELSSKNDGRNVDVSGTLLSNKSPNDFLVFGTVLLNGTTKEELVKLCLESCCETVGCNVAVLFNYPENGICARYYCTPDLDFLTGNVSECTLLMLKTSNNELQNESLSTTTPSPNNVELNKTIGESFLTETINISMTNSSETFTMETTSSEVTDIFLVPATESPDISSGFTSEVTNVSESFSETSNELLESASETTYATSGLTLESIDMSTTNLETSDNELTSMLASLETTAGAPMLLSEILVISETVTIATIYSSVSELSTGEDNTLTTQENNYSIEERTTSSLLHNNNTEETTVLGLTSIGNTSNEEYSTILATEDTNTDSSQNITTTSLESVSTSEKDD